MSNTTHTPGPWTVAYGHKSNSMGIYQEVKIELGEESTPICLVSPMDQVDETDKANARLISAAPDLLAALEKALSDPERLSKAALAYFLKERYPVVKEVSEDADWYGSIKKAIDKAKGL